MQSCTALHLEASADLRGIDLLLGFYCSGLVALGASWRCTATLPDTMPHSKKYMQLEHRAARLRDAEAARLPR